MGKMNARAVEAQGPVAPRKRRNKPSALMPGVIDGEKVFVARPKAESERALMIRIRVALTSAGGVLIWRNEVAKARRLSDGGVMPFGLGVGSADLVGVVAPYGRFLAVEIKRPRIGKVSEEQGRWIAAVRRHGGVAGVATSVEEALRLLEEARRR